MKHKLSDIFKTDNIESKRRILNRFELTKEDKADIINMSGKSNGAGSGTSKIHYYRLDNESIIQELRSLGYEDSMIIQMMTAYCMSSSGHIYNAHSDDARGIYYNGFTPIIDGMWKARRVKALLISEDIYFGQYPYITKGDLYIKVNNDIKFAATESPEEAEFVKSIFDIFLKYTTEITEDEFFGMCGLPIAPLPE